MLGLSRTMAGGLEDEATLDHPGNAVVKPVTVGLDPWETHELGGNSNTTNSNNVIIKCSGRRNISTCPSLCTWSLFVHVSLFVHEV